MEQYKEELYKKELAKQMIKNPGLFKDDFKTVSTQMCGSNPIPYLTYSPLIAKTFSDIIKNNKLYDANEIKQAEAKQITRK